MGAPERIVRHLRLRADSEAAVRRAALKLEDALRCASLPDAGSRLLLVRRLDLGVLAAGASPQTLSLLLEQRVAAVGGTWVHGADPNAHRADFVFFRDALEARCELALRLARAVPCATWFWPLAVPEFKVVDGAQANLRRMALSIAALPEAPAALPAWIARLTTAGVAPVLVQAIGPVDAAALMRAAHLAVDTPRARAIQIASSAVPQFSAQDADRDELPPRGTIDTQFTALPMWAQTFALAGGFVPRVVSVVPVVHAAHADRAAMQSQPSIEPPRQRYRDAETASTWVGHDANAKDMHEPTVSKQIKRDTAHVLDLPNGIPAETTSEPALSGWPFRAAAPSDYGGLLFLLPVLQRLGYADWAEALPEMAATHIVQQVMTLVLQRLRAPSGDPAWNLVSRNLDDEFGNIDVKAPKIWSASALAAPRGSSSTDIVALAEQARSTDAFAHVWLIACRRWLRRVAGIGVATLVVRPAAIGITATHADVFFRLSDADMRVRRAGLDFDPGWLPWCGRVITFHYDHEERS